MDAVQTDNQMMESGYISRSIRLIRRRIPVTAVFLSGLFLLGGLVPLLLGAEEKPERVYVDEDYDFTVAAPGNWERADPSGINVPGEICRAWTSDGSTIITVFMQKPENPVDPRALLKQSAGWMKENLGVEVKMSEVKELAGMNAMSLVVTGKGTGSALDGKGSVPTAQRWVAIPRQEDIIVFLLSSSEVKFASAHYVFQNMLATLKVGGGQTTEQKQAE